MGDAADADAALLTLVNDSIRRADAARTAPGSAASKRASERAAGADRPEAASSPAANGSALKRNWEGELSFVREDGGWGGDGPFFADNIELFNNALPFPPPLPVA